MKTVIERSEEILEKINSEEQPLRNALHYREAADILPELLQYCKELEPKPIYTRK
jgi:hypothetical protein